MPVSVAQKLRIRENNVLLTLHAPEDLKKKLGSVPAGVSFIARGGPCDQVHWFVRNRAQLEKEATSVLQLLHPGMIVWVYFPKGSSGIQTDLTRDKGWDCLRAEDEKLTWINLISFDDTWSVFGFRSKEGDHRKKEAKKPEREIFNWVNPKTKEVHLPADVATVFSKNKRAVAFFDTLSFTNRKEYLEWIVTAKQEKTRNDRIRSTVERLLKGWKNPRNQ